MDRADQPCFFILGYGRSGTTLLRRMVSAHPRLFVAPENDVFQRVPPLAGSNVRTGAELDRIVREFPDYYERIYDVRAFSAEALSELPLRTAEFVALLQTHALIGQEKHDAMWGHKAPSEWPYISTMRRWYPQATFIHLVRHPHDATASMVHHQLQRYQTSPLVAIWQWRKTFRAIRRNVPVSDPTRYRLLRYEDLVADPSTALNVCCDLLQVGSEAVPQMIDFLSDPSSVHTDEGEHMAGSKEDLTTARAGSGVMDYTEAENAMLDYVCRREMAQLNYPPRAGGQPRLLARRAYDVSCLGLDVAWAGLRLMRRTRGQL